MLNDWSSYPAIDYKILRLLRFTELQTVPNYIFLIKRKLAFQIAHGNSIITSASDLKFWGWNFEWIDWQLSNMFESSAPHFDSWCDSVKLFNNPLPFITFTLVTLIRKMIIEQFILANNLSFPLINSIIKRN